MIESFLSVGTQVLILFLMIGTGFVLGKLHLITHKGAVSMSNLLMYVVSPCILIVVFQRPLETETFHNFWVALLAALVIHGINILVSELVIRDRDPMRKSFFRFSAIFSNCGFMAVPLQTAILGSLGVFYGSAYLLVFTVLTWTLGIQLVKGGKMAFSWRTLLMNPGVIGVAIAMVLYLLQKPACPLRVDGLRALAPDGGLIRRILRGGIPAGIENGMFQIGKLSVSSLTSTLGTAAIAANAVAGNISSFLNVPASAVGIGALTVVGQCLGAGEKVQAKRYSRLLLLTAYAGDWVMNLSGLFFLNKLALSWFNLSPEAYGMALELMVWFNAVSLILWPSSFTLPNILRAAGDARFTMAVSILSMWVFRVGFCYLAVLCFGGGLLSIWMGMYLDWVFRSLCFYLRFRRGSWLEQSVI